MLAAAPSPRSSSLDLVRLALLMVQKGEPNIPFSLKEYFAKVFSQAKTLAGDPSQVKEQILPEAIDLALEMRSVGEFSEELKKIENIDKISPELAEKLLNTMEAQPVCQD